MKPVKQGIDISFAQGLDTKTDPKRVQIGKFVDLQNSVFDKGGLLQKRNGNKQLTTLPDIGATYLTTFKENLTAIGTSVAAYDAPNATWVTPGPIQPMNVSTSSLLHNSFNQVEVDAVIAPNGLICATYIEDQGGGTLVNKYIISDSNTSQVIVIPGPIPVASGTVSGGMHVFVLGVYFIIVFTNTISGTAHLQFVAININNPSVVTTNVDIANVYTPATTLSWDGIVVGQNLYVSWDTTSGGQSVKMVSIDNVLAVSSAITFSGAKATIMSMCADITNPGSPVIYANFWSSSNGLFTLAVDQNLNILMNPVQDLGSGTTLLNVTSAAQNGVCSIFYEVSNAYSFDSSLPSNFIGKIDVTPDLLSFHSVFSSGAGSITVSSASRLVNGMFLVDNTTPTNIAVGTTFTVSGTTLTLSNNTGGNSASTPGDLLVAATISAAINSVRSVGLASKAFIIDGTIFYLAAFESAYQDSYFLINGSLSTQGSPVVVAKLAYSNGGGYLTKGLPSVTVTNNLAQVPYLYKTTITPVNKATNVPTHTQIVGIYSQLGINLADFLLGTQGLETSEIGNNLHLSGGFLWMYDGYIPVEHNFFIYPDTDSVNPTDMASWSASGGSVAAQPDGSTNTNAYFYIFTYEWTDNQGNTFRSAPSIPIAVTTTGSGSSGSITLNIPTARLTYKVEAQAKICAYRWSVAQQTYYQTTSIENVVLNNTVIDSVQFVDTNSDATILGNNILYTNGGEVEDTNGPATNIMALFNERLFLVDAENKNLLWYSKQVIQSTPVQMSNSFTIYVAPTTATQGNTGDITALSVMDDKLIIFKKNAIYYINGTGPDNAGQNNNFSEPIFVTATVGCTNQQSVVFQPEGLMFESDKGIWILRRDLTTDYIGAEVQRYNPGNVLASTDIPGTNQIRFLFDTNVTVMYDYYYKQWGTFTGIPGISGCLYQNLWTFINSSGSIYQENPGSYVDGSSPVLMYFKTGPIRIGQLQNYQRTFFYYLLGQYISPHKLYVSNYYDYNDNPEDSRLISPINYSPNYGNPGPYGAGNPYGGPSSAEDWRVFAQRRCMAIAISVQEIYDPSFGVPPGAGLTLSGINMVCGFKGPFRSQSSALTVG